MADSDDVASLASSLQRGILGVLLALLALAGLGWGYRSLTSGRLLGGVALGIVGAVAALLVVALFVEGLREGR